MLINLTDCNFFVIVDPTLIRRKRLKQYADKSQKHVVKDQSHQLRQDAEVNELRKRGGETYTYAVGCGKCEICEKERIERKNNKWFNRLTGMISWFREHGFSTFRKGGEKHYPRGEVFFMTLTVSNKRYPGASWLKRRLSNTEVYNLNKDYRFRKRSLREVRHWFHQMMHDVYGNRERPMPYVVFPEFGSKNTRRVHLHVFFFVPGDPGEAFVALRNLLAYWQHHTLTDQGDIRLIDKLRKGWE